MQRELISRAGTLACTDATPCTVPALLRCYLLATHFGGFSTDLNLFQLLVLCREAN